MLERTASKHTKEPTGRRLIQFLVKKTKEEPTGRNYRCPTKVVIVLVYLFIKTVNKGMLLIIKMYNQYTCKLSFSTNCLLNTESILHNEKLSVFMEAK